jgi:peptide chain release factor 3
VTSSAQLISEVSRRRTFAIISHPDAGKTTLTEKLLLYSGMIRTAGMVRARKGGKAASSDWMALEQERGISITASAMQFPYKNALINVLDTPGHQDFSEDTYRTLTAADCAVMVIDSSKGVEAQTRKLFSVCKMRGIPVMTFMNKMDLEGRDPFELINEVEEVLGIHASPRNWPIGQGSTFAGVAEVDGSEVTLFEKKAAGGAVQAATKKISINELNDQHVASSSILERLQDELELVRGAGNEFSRDDFLAGKITPVFFGSAITNFGVENFFDAFVDLAPPPSKRECTLKDKTGEMEKEIAPTEQFFSAYVFKIQANMNPKHRDSMAFLRVCSGAFERDLVVKTNRSDKEIRLSRPHSMLAGERSTIDIAYPGDIVGVINPGAFALGDTLSLEGNISYKRMPQFPPEVVSSIRLKDMSKRKSFDKGLEQLSAEGAVQLLRPADNPNGEPLIAAVGRLQFEVLQYRLKNEYNVETILEQMPHECGAWLEGDRKTFQKPSSAMMTLDRFGRTVVLFRNQWEKQYCEGQNPGHKLLDFVA